MSLRSVLVAVCALLATGCCGDIDYVNVAMYGCCSSNGGGVELSVSSILVTFEKDRDLPDDFLELYRTEGEDANQAGEWIDGVVRGFTNAARSKGIALEGWKWNPRTIAQHRGALGSATIDLSYESSRHQHRGLRAPFGKLQEQGGAADASQG